jgi:hypothetical protein
VHVCLRFHWGNQDTRHKEFLAVVSVIRVSLLKACESHLLTSNLLSTGRTMQYDVRCVEHVSLIARSIYPYVKFCLVLQEHPRQWSSHTWAYTYKNPSNGLNNYRQQYVKQCLMGA